MNIIYQNCSENFLIKMAKTDPDAREELFYRYENMVYKIVSKYKNTGVEYEDLKSEAILGLYVALSKFDITRKVKFSTYSTNWIKERILKLIKDNNRKVSIAYNKLNKIQQIKKIEELVDNTISNEEKNKFICENLNITEKQLTDLNYLRGSMLSLDDPTCIEMVEPKTVEREFEIDYIKQSVWAAISELEDLERNIIIEFYFRNKSFKEIKKSFGLDYKSVKTSMEKALDSLKSFLVSVGIDN
jgi:RNA polymerase sigma factor for flagellar operon FliA